VRDDFALKEPLAAARTVSLGDLRVEICEPVEFVGDWLRKSDTVAVRLPRAGYRRRTSTCRGSACDVAIVVVTLVAILCLPIILHALIADAT
jgi:hypothetical protein